MRQNVQLPEYSFPLWFAVALVVVALAGLSAGQTMRRRLESAATSSEAAYVTSAAPSHSADAKPLRTRPSARRSIKR